MTTSYQRTQVLMDQVVKDLEAYRDLVGGKDERKAALYGFVPGLELENETKALEDQLKKLKEGIFQVLFTGVFTSGKSTLLNALMKKDVLRSSINAETAVVTKIIFNADEKVIVVMKKTDGSGVPICEEMSLVRFFEKYRVDQDNPDAFVDVDYVILQQPQDGIGGSMVQLVDSPGTNNSNADDVAAHDFAKKASAIVFLINATMAFNADEKDYIDEHFKGKKLRNLFFVINHIDGVNEDQIPALKENVRKQLSEVFTTDDGRFDEKLFDSRVFYTNAYDSLMARINKPIKVHGVEITPDDGTTGVPEFEEALAKFLTDDNRDKDALAAYLPKMANMYVAAENKVKVTLDNFRGGLENAMKDKAQLEVNIKKTEGIISGIEESCRQTVQSILMSARSEYESYVNRVSMKWDTYFENKTIENFSWRDLVSIVWNDRFGSEEKKKRANEKLKPIADAVSDYCKNEMNELNENMATHIQVQLTNLERALKNYQGQLASMNMPVDVNQILNKISMENASNQEDVGDVKTNMLQFILGVFGADPELALAGLGGGMSNKEFITNFIVKNVFEFIAWNVVAWPIGIAMLVGRVISTVKGMSKTANQTAGMLIKNMKDGTIDGLKDGKDKFLAELEKNLGGPVLRAGSEFGASFKNELDGHLETLEYTIKQLESDSSAAAKEEARTEELLREMLARFNSVSNLTTGKTFTVDGVRGYATSKTVS